MGLRDQSTALKSTGLQRSPGGLTDLELSSAWLQGPLSESSSLSFPCGPTHAVSPPPPCTHTATATGLSLGCWYLFQQVHSDSKEFQNQIPGQHLINENGWGVARCQYSGILPLVGTMLRGDLHPLVNITTGFVVSLDLAQYPPIPCSLSSLHLTYFFFFPGIFPINPFPKILISESAFGELFICSIVNLYVAGHGTFKIKLG